MNSFSSTVSMDGKNLITSLFKEIDLIRNIQNDNGITDTELGEILELL